MKKNNYLIAFVSMVLISYIQSEPRNQHKTMLPMDKDNNGVISFKEFSSKKEKMFSFLDHNSDGSITKQEMVIAEQARKEKMLSKMADRLDRNDDLKIDMNEFISGSKGLPNHPKKSKRKDHPHGKIEDRKEVSKAIFMALDKNKDGFLANQELAEVREVGPKVAKDFRLKKIDSNGNNKISKEEFMSAITQEFAALDRNSDQLIDRRELKNRKGASKRDESYENNMWKGRPPTMHKERKRR